MRIANHPRIVNSTGENPMRLTTIILACVLFAPLAMGQTNTTKIKETTTTQMSSSRVAIGTVVSFTPAKRVVTPASPIVVQSSPDVRPIAYVLARKVHYVDQAGRAVDPAKIRSGARVHLDFDRAGKVRRVVVVEKE